MKQQLENKIYSMFWDYPQDKRESSVREFLNDPVVALSDKKILLRALNTLSWYELVSLSGGTDYLHQLLDENTINLLFPATRRNYYKDAKRLLSKYIISASG